MSDWFVPEWATSLGTRPSSTWRDGTYNCATLWDILDRRWPGVPLNTLLHDLRENGPIYLKSVSPVVRLNVHAGALDRISGLADRSRSLRDGCSLAIWIPGTTWGDTRSYHIYIDEPMNAFVIEQDQDADDPRVVLGPGEPRGFSRSLLLDDVVHDVFAQLAMALAVAAQRPEAREHLPPRTLSMAELGPWLRERSPMPFHYPPEAQELLSRRAPYLIDTLDKLSRGMGWTKIAMAENRPWSAVRAELLVALGFMDERVDALRKLGVAIKESREPEVVAYLDSLMPRSMPRAVFDQLAAQDRVLDMLGAAADVTAEERAAIEAEWKAG